MYFPLRHLLLTTVSSTDNGLMAPPWQLCCFSVRAASKPEACTQEDSKHQSNFWLSALFKSRLGTQYTMRLL